MAINTKLKTDIAFKRLAGNVSITNPSANQFQESITPSSNLFILSYLPINLCNWLEKIR